MKLLQIALSSAILSTSFVSAEPCTAYCECALSDMERDKIWNEAHRAIQRMYNAMDKADEEASKITDVNIESATKAAIAGAVGGLSTRNPYGVVITCCLNTIGSIAGDSYWHFREAKRYVREAEYYAKLADELQERLWRDK